MDKDSALGWVIIGAVAYLGYKALKQGSLFGGAAAALFGDDLASGKVGERAGEVVANLPVVPGTRTVQNPDTGLFYNADPSTWDPRYAQGYQQLSSGVNLSNPLNWTPAGFLYSLINPGDDVMQVNVSVTGTAFAKIGLTTTQVERLQMAYPKLVAPIVYKLKNHQPLTDQEKAALTSVGASSAFAPIVTDIGGGQYVGIGVGGFQDPTYGF